MMGNTSMAKCKALKGSAVKGLIATVAAPMSMAYAISFKSNNRKATQMCPRYNTRLIWCSLAYLQDIFLRHNCR